MNEKLEKYADAYEHYSKLKVENKIIEKRVRFGLIKKLKLGMYGPVAEYEEEQPAKEWSKLSKIILITILVISLVLLAVFIAYLADFFIYKDTEFDGLLLTKAQRFHGIFWRYF
ncbi:hypothetical protein NPA08_03545 [Mycoplasmopsis citelli]|uniref:Uncharacterized protein n=1 Tax=Mycoplasmopsis citelli TaxID=171281 RepID=A0A449B1S1_9BACT|nr:hypothetical protein [Mycoplasmopsis citelli]UUD36005.1 hypothetical protein NPA08_03545 [Mycoplasmopsis citelli]VEU74550.1 Uncharacterised protein [Mycoplasmopsis citelli]